MGCSKKMTGVITLDHARKEEYRPLIKELRTIALVRGAVKFNGAILVLEINEDMDDSDALRFDRLVGELHKFATEGAKIWTKWHGQARYIYFGPPSEVRRLKTEQACLELSATLAGIGNRPDVDLPAIKRHLIKLANDIPAPLMDSGHDNVAIGHTTGGYAVDGHESHNVAIADGK